MDRMFKLQYVVTVLDGGRVYMWHVFLGYMCSGFRVYPSAVEGHWLTSGISITTPVGILHIYVSYYQNR